MNHKRLIDEGSVWILVAPLSLWAAHFLLCYWVAAIWCAKMAIDGPAALWAVRLVIGTLTMAALAVFVLLALIARRRYRGDMVVDEEITGDTETARRHFLGHVALLLCALGAMATLFSAIPILVFDQCW